MSSFRGSPEGAASLRARTGAWVESPRIQGVIVGVILLNAVTLGLETSHTVMANYGWILGALDRTILGVFVVEIGLKLFARGWGFFRQAWNVFDFSVVAVALIPAGGFLSVLRVLRLLRLISMVPRLRFVVEALIHSLPGISSIALLMVLLYYVAAVMATQLFGGPHPEWFGTIGRSMYTLFQIMTLESWSMGVVRPVMQTQPYAWLFFIPFILVATFTVLNLFIAIIVNTMQTLHDNSVRREEEAIDGAMHRQSQELQSEIRNLRDELRALRRQLDRGGTDGRS